MLDTSSPLVDAAELPRPGTLSLVATIARSAAARARQTVACAVARRAMERVRRQPAVLTDALRGARQVLVVCHGNIIRSAFAGRLLQQRLSEAAPLRVVSAGVEAVPGRPAHPIAVRVASQRRVDLSHHAATRVSAELVGASDVVLAVDLLQFVALRQLFPDARAKIFLLTSLAPSTPMEIADPINGDERAFDVCFQHITQAVDAIGPALGSLTVSR